VSIKITGKKKKKP